MPKTSRKVLASFDAAVISEGANLVYSGCVFEKHNDTYVFHPPGHYYGLVTQSGKRWCASFRNTNSDQQDLMLSADRDTVIRWVAHKVIDTTR